MCGQVDHALLLLHQTTQTPAELQGRHAAHVTCASSHLHEGLCCSELCDLLHPCIRLHCLEQLLRRLFLQRVVRLTCKRPRLGLRTPLQSLTCRRLRNVTCSFRQRQRERRQQGRQEGPACRPRPGLKQGRRGRVSVAFLRVLFGANQRLQPALYLLCGYLFSQVEACDAADLIRSPRARPAGLPRRAAACGSGCTSP